MTKNVKSRYLIDTCERSILGRIEYQILKLNKEEKERKRKETKTTKYKCINKGAYLIHANMANIGNRTTEFHDLAICPRKSSLFFAFILGALDWFNPIQLLSYSTSASCAYTTPSQRWLRDHSCLCGDSASSLLHALVQPVAMQADRSVGMPQSRAHVKNSNLPCGDPTCASPSAFPSSAPSFTPWYATSSSHAIYSTC